MRDPARGLENRDDRDRRPAAAQRSKDFLPKLTVKKVRLAPAGGSEQSSIGARSSLRRNRTHGRRANAAAASP